MKKLIERLPKRRYQVGYKQVLYRCEHDCIIRKEDLTVIRSQHRQVIERCPYCNSNKLHKV